MPLANLQVFNEQVKTAQTEVLDWAVNKFNEATNGAIVLRSAAHAGDYAERSLFGSIAGLVRRRDATNDADDIAAVALAQLLDRSVKVAAGTPPVQLNPGDYQWIQMAPEAAAAALGQQLAVATLGDMLATAVRAFAAATIAQATNYYDGTGDGAGLLTPTMLAKGRAKMGDRGEDIAAWVVHSKPQYDYWMGVLAGTSYLFNWGGVKVRDDGFGHPIIMTDASPLIDTNPNPDQYFSCGIVPAGVVVEQNGDFYANYDERNGKNNIQRTYQAQWSYNVGLKGFQWDTGTGGRSPSDAALGTSGNWDKYATSAKDLAGVIVRSL